MPLVARCPDCNKRFRVPHANKAWRCKACGGALDIEAQPPTTEAEQVRCSACEAWCSPDATFCDSCGAALDGNQEEAARRTKRDESEASGEMRAAEKTVGRLRGYLKLVVVLRLMGLAGGIFLIFAALDPLGGDMLPGLIAVAANGIEVALLLVLIHQLTRRPFPAALSLAVLSTLNLTLALLNPELAGVGVLIAGGIGGAFCAFYWYVTVKAAALTRLSREYPDLFLSRRMRGEVQEGSVRQRSRTRRKRKSKPPYVGLGVIGAVVVGVLVVGILKRPDSPGETLERIEAAWNARDFDTLARYVEAPSREKWVANLERVNTIYDWGDAWPQASGYSFEIEEEVVLAELATEAGSLPFRLRWDTDNGWTLYRMSFSDVKNWKS